jgi:hypothetical protein
MLCETLLEPLMHASTCVEVSPPSFVINVMKIDCTSRDMPQSFSRASSLSLSPAPRLCIEQTTRNIKELSKEYMTNNLRVSSLWSTFKRIWTSWFFVIGLCYFAEPPRLAGSMSRPIEPHSFHTRVFIATEALHLANYPTDWSYGLMEL